MRSTGGRGVTVVTIVTLAFAPVFNGHHWFERLVGKTTQVQVVTCTPGEPCPPSRHEVQRLTVPGTASGSVAADGVEVKRGGLVVR